MANRTRKIYVKFMVTPEEKELLDAIMNLQYMLGDQKKLASAQYNQLLQEFEALKNKAP